MKNNDDMQTQARGQGGQGGQGGQAEDSEAREARDEMAGRLNDEAADIALAAVDELADRATEIDDIRAQLEETREQLLRKAADFQNYRRRTEQEKKQLVELGKGVVIQKLLDVFDDFGRSIEAAEQAEKNKDKAGAYDALKQGVDMVYRKFNDELSKIGVEPIEAVGRPFDEHEHEAMLQQPGPQGTPSGTVLQELQKGYRLGDRVLRHSRVIVSA